MRDHRPQSDSAVAIASEARPSPYRAKALYPDAAGAQKRRARWARAAAVARATKAAIARYSSTREVARLCQVSHVAVVYWCDDRRREPIPSHALCALYASGEDRFVRIADEIMGAMRDYAA
jgi:hypothetical protein